jgi:hypothetical protein
VTFPNIVDASELAKDIYFKEYQKPGRSAVPMNYVVDTEGRVADAWYGYSRGDEHGMKALEKAGLKPPSGGVGVQGPP